MFNCELLMEIPRSEKYVLSPADGDAAHPHRGQNLLSTRVKRPHRRQFIVASPKSEGASAVRIADDPIGASEARPIDAH